ncbi:unnamed protein product [Thelazia callipaeda]|uniref:DPPIV_N domain-containing protein n=1 Tax=Thelazia callipaeda TaxID=103827 RepID=A0A0N5D8F4_THECL|nr:unnamed protein product [Thelazia callipaeda]
MINFCVNVQYSSSISDSDERIDRIGSDLNITATGKLDKAVFGMTNYASDISQWYSLLDNLLLDEEKREEPFENCHAVKFYWMSPSTSRRSNDCNLALIIAETEYGERYVLIGFSNILGDKEHTIVLRGIIQVLPDAQSASQLSFVWTEMPQNRSMFIALISLTSQPYVTKTRNIMKELNSCIGRSQISKLETSSVRNIREFEHLDQKAGPEN